IVAIADLRGERRAAAEPLLRAGAELLTGHTIVEASGRRTGREAVLAPLSGGGSERRFACDLVLVSGGSPPASSLPLQSGARAEYSAEDGHFVLGELTEGVHAAGDLAGVTGAAAAAL